MPDETPAPDDTAHVDDNPAVETAVDGRDEPTDPIDRADTPPAAVVDEAERLTRLAREATDEDEAAAYREDRDERLSEHDYTARVREDETRDVFVCHPDGWVEDGTIRPDRIEDLDRGIERPLSGPGEGSDWELIEDHNRDLVEAVREDHGDVHAANVSALADFMGNHYARPIESATRAELQEFLEEYYPRNAWPTDEQRAVVKESVCLAFDAADERCPIERPR